MRKLTSPLNRVRFCVAIARELFVGSDVDGSAFPQARIVALLDIVSTGLPKLFSFDDPDADQLAHNSARLLEHACRLLLDMRFLDWSAGEAVFALIATASAELDALSRVIEGREKSGTAVVLA